MTLWNIISVGLATGIVITTVLVYRRLRREVDEADGLIGINYEGEPGTNDDGTPIAQVDGFSGDDAIERRVPRIQRAK